ncbi:hypothetical protein JCM24511_04536 [Saitozyma sp. JCM 24511]|nr:hypothetical protein JCM24511_04536 [Saitozyma sp. JCM 24511]
MPTWVTDNSPTPPLSPPAETPTSTTGMSDTVYSPPGQEVDELDPSEDEGDDDDDHNAPARRVALPTRPVGRMLHRLHQTFKKLKEDNQTAFLGMYPLPQLHGSRSIVARLQEVRKHSAWDDDEPGLQNEEERQWEEGSVDDDDARWDQSQVVEDSVPGRLASAFSHKNNELDDFLLHVAEELPPEDLHAAKSCLKWLTHMIVQHEFFQGDFPHLVTLLAFMFHCEPNLKATFEECVAISSDSLKLHFDPRFYRNSADKEFKMGVYGYMSPQEQVVRPPPGRRSDYEVLIYYDSCFTKSMAHAAAEHELTGAEHFRGGMIKSTGKLGVMHRIKLAAAGRLCFVVCPFPESFRGHRVPASLVSAARSLIILSTGSWRTSLEDAELQLASPTADPVQRYIGMNVNIEDTCRLVTKRGTLSYGTFERLYSLLQTRELEYKAVPIWKKNGDPSRLRSYVGRILPRTYDERKLYLHLSLKSRQMFRVHLSATNSILGWVLPERNNAVRAVRVDWRPDALIAHWIKETLGGPGQFRNENEEAACEEAALGSQEEEDDEGEEDHEYEEDDEYEPFEGDDDDDEGAELTAQAFHRIGAPYLYGTIVTQDLPLLFDHLRRPSEISGVATKTQLLGYCLKLFIEFKQYGRETGYTELLHRNDWRGVGMTVEERETRAVDQASLDIEGIGWNERQHLPLRDAILKVSRRILSRIRTLSMCALASPDPVDWHQVFDPSRSGASVIPLFITAVVRRLGLDHLCQHMTNPNPLLLDGGNISPGPSPTSVFVHFPSSAVGAPCIPNSTVTCIYHDRTTHIKKCGRSRAEDFDDLGGNILTFLQHRLRQLTRSRTSVSSPGENVTPSMSLKLYAWPGLGQDLEQYLDHCEPEPIRLPPQSRTTQAIDPHPRIQRSSDIRRLAMDTVESDCRKIASFIERWMNESLGPDLLSEIDLEWRTIDEAPRCQACGFKETSFLDELQDDDEDDEDDDGQGGSGEGGSGEGDIELAEV